MKNIMVCVTKQVTCQRLIDYGKNLMKDKDDTLHIIHVSGSDYNFLGDSEETRALEYLYDKSREVGAELTVLKSDDVLGTLVKLAKDNNINLVVAGDTNESRDPRGFLPKFDKALGDDIELVVVPADFS